MKHEESDSDLGSGFVVVQCWVSDESTRGYPHSTLPTGHNPDLQTTQSKWRHEPDKKYKYYW